MSASPPTVVSTFSGCGGSSLGYTLAGFKVRLAVEWNDHAAATYRENFPETPIFHGDIAKLSVAEALDRAQLRPGELDVFDGSPPCQGFSTAGKRRLDDPRNGLFREYVRLLRGFNPRAFVFENVAGMVKGKMRLVYREVLAELEAAGYVVVGATLFAMYYGVAQRRERLLILGARQDLGVTPSHPAPESDPTTAGAACPSLLDGAPDPSDVVAADYLTGGALTVWHKKGLGKDHAHASVLIARGRSQDCPRFHPGKVAPTILSQALGWAAPCHPYKPRALSGSELAALAGFPTSFRWIGARTDVQARIGNCVPPPLMRAIASHLRKTILA